MAQAKKQNQGQVSWVKKWVEPAILISIAAFGLSAYQACNSRKSIEQVNASLDHRLKGTEDALRQLASVQSEPVRNAVDHDLATKTVVPEEVFLREQQTVKQLVSIAPDSLPAWRAMGAVASYRSAAYASTPFPQDRPCPALSPSPLPSSPLSLAPPHEGDGSVRLPRELVETMMYLKGIQVSMGNCTIDIGAVQLPAPSVDNPRTNVLLFSNAIIVYRGGPLPEANNIFFYNCTFRFEPITLPSNEGKELMFEALDSAPGTLLKVAGQSS